MSDRYFEFTYRNGKPLAGYLYLSEPGIESVRTDEAEAGLLVDFGADGKPIGIEITSPSFVSLDAINRVLSLLEMEPVTSRDVAPLAFAG